MEERKMKNVAVCVSILFALTIIPLFHYSTIPSFCWRGK